MAHSQTWALSQTANKSSGICSVCYAARQLHNKDGTVHRHGPRCNPCPGSGKPPLQSGNGPTAGLNTDSASTIATAIQSPCPALGLTDISPVGSSRPTAAAGLLNMQSNGPVIKHIPKSARSACASHLASLLDIVVANPHDLSSWESVLQWSQQALFPPKRAGRKH